MSQVVKKLQSGGNSPKTYGHLWVDGIDYGNSEEVYNAFANHARSQGLNQGEFYDQWLTALRNGQDVKFGNGNTVNMRPEGMSEKRAGKRSGWTRFWDDTFDNRRNHFSDAIATARRFTFSAPKPKEEAPKEKSDFDTSEIILNYNDDPNKKGHRIWSTGAAENQRAIQRVTDAIAGLKDPDNSDYKFNDTLKAAYQIAANSGMTPEEYVAAIWSRLQDNAWEGYKNPDNDNDLDWLKAFGIGIGSSQAAVASGSSEGVDGEGSQQEEEIYTAPDGKKYKIGENGTLILIEEETPQTRITSDNTTINGNNGTGGPAISTRDYSIEYYPSGLGNAGQSGIRPVSATGSFIPVGERDGKQIVKDTAGNFFILQPGTREGSYFINPISEAFGKSVLDGEKYSGKQWLEQLGEYSPLVYRQMQTSGAAEGGGARKEGGKIDFNKVNAFAKGGRVVKAYTGVKFDPNWKPGTIPSMEDLFKEQLEAAKNPGNTAFVSSDITKPETYTQYQIRTTATNTFGTPDITGGKTIFDLAKESENPTVQTRKPVVDEQYSGDPNTDSSTVWPSVIKGGLAALDYGVMAWGRKKVHDQIEKGLWDSLYRKTTPRLDGINTATPVEDAQLAQWQQEYGKGLKPVTSNAIANYAMNKDRQASILPQMNQAIRQQSAAALQRQQANQQIANQQAQLDAEAENDFRARLSSLRMSLAQNDASLTTQQAQSLQNLIREGRTKFEEDDNKYKELAYNANLQNTTNAADRNWLNTVQNSYSDIWAAWQNEADKAKYGYDFNTWTQNTGRWNDALEAAYNENRAGLTRDTLSLYRKKINPGLAYMYRDREGVPARKSGGSLTVKQRNRYKNEPSEDIWINQNKAAHKAVAKFNDNIIKAFLKTLK